MPSGIKAHAVAQVTEIFWQTFCLLNAFTDGLDADNNDHRIKYPLQNITSCWNAGKAMLM